VYIATQERDKKRLVIKYGRYPETVVATIVSIDGLASRVTRYKCLKYKMSTILSLLIILIATVMAFTDLNDYLDKVLVNWLHIICSAALFFYLFIMFFLGKNK
jgi:hypothetical protein